MTKKRWSIVVLLLSVGAMLAIAIPAHGEFESTKKETTGKGIEAELQLSAGGATVLCQNLESTTKNTTWAIKSEGGTATIKGPTLSANAENWGECTLESSELKATTAKVSECGVEVKQPKAEEEVPGVLTKSCTVTASSCEIKAEANENKSVKVIDLASMGENTGLAVDPAIQNLATATNGKCAGVSATKEGKLSGFLELEELTSSLVPEFTITSTRTRFNAAAQVATVTIHNTGALMQGFYDWEYKVAPGNSFSSTGESTCASMTYTAAGSGATEKCTFTIESKNRGRARWFMRGAHGAYAHLEASW